jgi:glycosylphosphatidylinositol deacylase
MRRRSSGSTEEDDPEEPPPPSPWQLEDDGRKRSFTSSKFDVTRHSDTLDRRKVEKLLSPSTVTQTAWFSEPDTYDRTALPARSLAAAGRRSSTAKMQDPPDRWGRSRLRSPWKVSLLTLLTTAVSILFLFTVVHSLVTRQLDPKGCGMSFMSPMYAKLSGFDTEHTRFASKYSLYLYREGGVDEDTMVREIAHSRH